jgi:endo-1,3(4)-beta-glucanase
MNTFMWIAFWQAMSVCAMPVPPPCPVEGPVSILKATATEQLVHSSTESLGGIFHTSTHISTHTSTHTTITTHIISVASNNGQESSHKQATSSSNVLPRGTSTVKTSTVIPSVSVMTQTSNSGRVQVLPTLSTQDPNTKGIVNTVLKTTGQATNAPILSTSIPTPTSLLRPSTAKTSPTSSVPFKAASQDIFQPIATNAPPGVIGSRPDHPVPKLGVQQTTPIGTNKFYANFFLGSQTAASWTHPYSVAWVKGGGQTGSWGMAISHMDANQKVFGPDPTQNPVHYFINPIGIQSIILSAVELGKSTTLTTDSLTAFSANVNLASSSGASPLITFPLVQGMGFVTAQYNGGTPLLQSNVFFSSITKISSDPRQGVKKFRIVLADGKTWLLYAYSSTGNDIDFTVVNNGLAQATSNFRGIIQIAKNPNGNADAIYDQACGAYPITTTLSGAANGAAGTYTFSHAKGGIAGVPLLMFALPHHMASLAPVTASAATSLQLATTTKGMATAILADSWTLVEALPTTLGFAPWIPTGGSRAAALSPAAVQAIQAVAQSEVSQDMNAQSNLNSMYYSGKVSKFTPCEYNF